jgi:hypothetical protein
MVVVYLYHIRGGFMLKALGRFVSKVMDKVRGKVAEEVPTAPTGREDGTRMLFLSSPYRLDELRRRERVEVVEDVQTVREGRRASLISYREWVDNCRQVDSVLGRNVAF